MSEQIVKKYAKLNLSFNMRGTIVYFDLGF